MCRQRSYKWEDMSMYFLLFGFWVLLNGQWTTEIAIVGAIVCAALYAFMCAFMGYSPKQESRYPYSHLRMDS